MIARRRHAFTGALTALTALALAAPLCAQQTSAPQQIGAHTFVFSNARNDLLVHVAPHASFVAGVQDPALVSAARAWLAARHAPSVRWVVAAAGENAAQYGDGGWGATGATVVAHEALRYPMMSLRGSGRSTAPNAVPALGFSDVVQMSLGDDEAHAVHQKEAGYGKSDVTVHLEGADVLYLGNLVTTDGYPDIDVASGGTINGMITTITAFVDNFGSDAKMRVVPGRGPTIGTRELRDYRDMLVGVRDRVQPLVTAGRSDAQIVAARPTSAYDARWGHGRVSPDRFVTLVAQSLRKR